MNLLFLEMYICRPIFNYLWSFISTPEEAETFEDNYDIICPLGKGKFGTVDLCERIEDKEQFAVKHIRKSRHQAVNMDLDDGSLLSEISVLQNTCHKHLIKLIEYYESHGYYHLVLEYYKDSITLHHYLQYHTPTEEEEASFFLSQITSGIDYMHSKYLAHMDVKPDNVIMTTSRCLKLIDFGNSMSTDCSFNLQVKGVAEFVPPELDTNDICDARMVDIWQMGTTLFYIMTRRFPFTSRKDLVRGTFTMPENFSFDLKELLTGMLQASPSRRYSIKKVLYHDWISSSLTPVLPEFQQVSPGSNMQVPIEDTQ